MMFRKDVKTDLGTFNFPQTGWWIMHAAAIAGMYMIGKRGAQMDWLDD